MIDVLIPVYNASRTIVRSVESCITQKYLSNVIIVDDCSTDDTLMILKSNYGSNSNVLIVERRSNGGIVAALNAGLEHVKAEYVARLDADDVMMPNRLEMQLEFLKLRDLDLVGSDMVSLENNNHVIKCFGNYQGEIKRRDLYFMSVFHPTWLGKTACFSQMYKVGSPVEDLFFQFQLIHRGFRLGVMNIPTTYYMTMGVSKITSKEKSYHWILATILRLSFAFRFQYAFEKNFTNIKAILKKNTWLFYLCAPMIISHIYVGKIRNLFKKKR